MSKSLFKSRYFSQNRLSNTTSLSRFSGIKRTSNLNTTSGIIDLGWVNKLTDRLENYVNLSTFFYQIIALTLLTLGMFLTYQSFNNLKISDNSVALAKEEIKLSNEKRIWTDVSSIDQGLSPIEFKVAPSKVAITQYVAKNECAQKVSKIQAKISENQKINFIDKCETSVSNGETNILIPNKVITVKSGDNFSSIANEYKTSIKTILELNNLSSESKLKIGQELLISTN